VSRSTHKFARLDAIASKGELGSVLIRLMMIINDMSLAMDAQRRWTEDANLTARVTRSACHADHRTPRLHPTTSTGRSCT